MSCQSFLVSTQCQKRCWTVSGYDSAHCGYTIRSAHALNYVVETLDGQAAQLAAYFCRLHCVFHLTVHVGSILIFLNVAYAMHYDVFTWMPIQNNKGAFT